MRSMRAVFSCLSVCSLFLAGNVWAQADLEVPGPGSVQSGVALIQGWRCEPALIQIQIDTGNLITAAYGTSRNDTMSVCGDADNGWGLTWNWNLSGSGEHTVRAFADGAEFGSATFTVTTLGVEFLTGVTGGVVAQNFPETGMHVGLEWQQSAQNFIITEVFETEPVELREESVDPNVAEDVFEVPPDQRLIITDVLITNKATGPATARLFRNLSPATTDLAIGASSTFAHTFQSGIEFGPGQDVRVRNNGGSAGSLEFYLRGYLTSP